MKITPNSPGQSHGSVGVSHTCTELPIPIISTHGEHWHVQHTVVFCIIQSHNQETKKDGEQHNQAGGVARAAFCVKELYVKHTQV